MIARILIILFLFVGVSHSTIYTAPVVGGGTSPYLLSETWEGGVGCGTGSCDESGWVFNPNETGYINPDYATTTIEGSSSLLVDDPSGTAMTLLNSIPANGDVYMCMTFSLLNYVGYPTATFDAWYFETSAGVDVAVTEIRTTGQLRINLDSDQGSGSGIGSFTIDACESPAYCTIWMEYEKGSGSDGVGRVYIVANSKTKPSVDASLTDGTTTDDVERFKFQFATSKFDIILDEITISDTLIGNCP